MPKIVDHSLQRKRIATAALRLIESQGLEHTTVRAIASEAGMSVGSMRHYITTQDDLFIFAMQICAEQNKARIEALPRTGSLREQLQRLLEELLPLDRERRLETEVWLAFVARAQNKPSLTPILKEMNDGILFLIQVVVEVLITAGYLQNGASSALEADRLLALVNGLAINGLLFPETMTSERMSALLQNHLSALVTDPSSS